MAPHYRAYLLLSIAVFFWGGNVIIARALSHSISAVALNCGRWWLATLLILPFAWKFLKNDWLLIRRHWLLISVLGLLGVSLFNTLLYQAAHTTSSTNIALIQTTMPAMIIVMMALFFREQHHLRAWVGVLVSILGAMLVVSRGDWQVFMQWQFAAGDLWMLLANFFYGVYSILLRSKPVIHDLSLLAASFVAGSLILIPLFAWDLQQHSLPAMNLQLGASLLYVAIFPSILSYFFWNRGVALVGASLAGFFICLIPVFTAMLARIFLDEMFYWYHVAGLMMIFSGFILFQKKPGKPRN